MATKKGQGEDLSLTHWLRCEKLNLCMPCDISKKSLKQQANSKVPKKKTKRFVITEIFLTYTTRGLSSSCPSLLASLNCTKFVKIKIIQLDICRLSCHIVKNSLRQACA